MSQPEKVSVIDYFFSKKGKLLKEKNDLAKQIDELNLENEVLAKRDERDKLLAEVLLKRKTRVSQQEKDKATGKEGQNAKAGRKRRAPNQGIQDEDSAAKAVNVDNALQSSVAGKETP